MFFDFAFLKRGIALMNKRRNERHQTLTTGTISFQDSKVDCAVHDLSLAGASIEVDSQTGIPDSFDLLLADAGKDLVVSFGAKRSGLVLLSHSRSHTRPLSFRNERKRDC